MRTKRIVSWIMTIVIACIMYFGEPFVLSSNSSKEDKTQITLYAPTHMQVAFKHALKNSEMQEDYEMVMVNDKNADICVEYGKENDEEYFKFAFSPFVVAYTQQEDYIKQLEKSEVVIPSQYEKNYREIDFLKIIDEVRKDGLWENLGVSKLDKIKVFYPERESVYWNDFFDFMLITINGGIYPQTAKEFETANEVVKEFEESIYTEGLSDFKEQISRTGGFPENVLYVLPEQEAYINGSFSKEIFFPTVTVYLNYYIKRNELTNILISHFSDNNFFAGGSFYYVLVNEYYRNNEYLEIPTSVDYITGERNVYNVAKIPKNKEAILSTNAQEQ